MPDSGVADAGENREIAGPPSGKNICVYLGGNVGREERATLTRPVPSGD